jgi:hypothetical protein
VFNYALSFVDKTLSWIILVFLNLVVCSCWYGSNELQSVTLLLGWVWLKLLYCCCISDYFKNDRALKWRTSSKSFCYV